MESSQDAARRAAFLPILIIWNNLWSPGPRKSSQFCPSPQRWSNTSGSMSYELEHSHESSCQTSCHTANQKQRSRSSLSPELALWGENPHRLEQFNSWSSPKSLRSKKCSLSSTRHTVEHLPHSAFMARWGHSWHRFLRWIRIWWQTHGPPFLDAGTRPQDAGERVQIRHQTSSKNPALA